MPSAYAAGELPAIPRRVRHTNPTNTTIRDNWYRLADVYSAIFVNIFMALLIFF